MREYGQLRREGDAWILTGDAHVILRCRRLFSESVGSRGGEISCKVMDTPSNCRDLCWVLERWPLAMADEDRERLEGAARLFDDANHTVFTLLTGELEPREFNLSIPLRRYQQIGAEAWMRVQGLLLADDLGLGKTATAIAGLMETGTRPAVVVTLANLCGQWEREFRKFAPSLVTHIAQKREPYDFSHWGQSPDVVILSYAKLYGWAPVLAGAKSVIFDEAQELRRTASMKYKGAQMIAGKATYRIGLSATPIHNYGEEFFNVLDVLRPGELGTSGEFNAQWCRNGYGQRMASIVNPVAFGAWLRDSGLMIRRTRSDVGIELPPVTKMTIPIDTDRKPLQEVSASCRELAEMIIASNAPRGQAMSASERLSNVLRQATGIAKAPHVADFVRMLLENDEPIVLFGWHREVYSIWLDRLEQFSPAMYTGSETVNRKTKSFNDFVAGKTKLLIMSLRSGAGLDGLQGVASTVVFGELDWSWSVMHQGVGRLGRPGQHNPTNAYFCIADTGSDPTMVDVLGLKREQLVGVTDPNAELVERLGGGEARIKRLAEDYLKR